MARALWLIDETKGPIDSDNHVVSLLSSSRWVSRARCQTVACCFCLFAFLCCVVSDTMADGCEPDVCVQMQKVCSDCFWHAYVRRCLRSFVSFFRHSAIRLRQTLVADGCESDVCVQMQKVCSNYFWHAYVRRCLRSFVSFPRHSAIRLDLLMCFTAAALALT